MTKINFPLSTKEIKIHQAIKIQKLLANEDLKEATKVVACLAEWTSTTMNDWAKVKQSQIDDLFAKMVGILGEDEYPDFERHIEIEGRKFAFIPNMNAIEFSEFGDIETIAQPDADGIGGGFEVFHKVMAILYRPILIQTGDRYTLESYADEPEEVTQERERFFLKYATYYQCRSAIFFFLPFSRELMNSSNQSLSHQEIQDLLQ
jgi:hypothetical protein